MDRSVKDTMVAKRLEPQLKSVTLDTSTRESVGLFSVKFRDYDDLLDSKHSRSEKGAKDTEHDEDFTNIIAKPDKDGDNLLFLAIILKLPDIVLLMIDLLKDYKILSRFNNNFQTALHLATLINDRRLVRRLVVAGAKVCTQDWRGDTALHVACKKGFTEVAEALLTPITYRETKRNSYEIPYQQIPQNLEIRNGDGLTCFLIATYNCYKNLMTLLLQNGADVNTFDMKSGKTPIHIVSENGDTSLLNYLLLVPGLKINSKTYSGYTALHFARMRRQNHAAYLLLCSGAQDIDDIIINVESDLDSDSGDEISE